MLSGTTPRYLAAEPVTVPGQSGDIEFVQKPSGVEPAEILAGDKAQQIFRRLPVEARQFSTNGRGCYWRVDAGDFVTVKSIGSNPSSQRTVEQMNKRWRTHLPPSPANPGVGAESAGATRVGTRDSSWIMLWGAYSPSFLQPSSLYVFEILAEGFCRFEDSALDLLVTKLLKQLPVKSADVLGLLRHRRSEPWDSSTTLTTPATYFTDQARSIEDRKFLNHAIRIDPFMMDTHLDGGMLMRRMDTPLRLQDIYLAALNGQWNDVRQTIDNLGGKKWIDDLIQISANNAGTLLQNGIILGQFFGNHQNYSVRGELVDHDKAVLTPWAPRELADPFIESMKEFDAEWGTTVYDVFAMHRRVIAPSNAVATCGVAEQAYMLLDKCLRFYDIFKRSDSGHQGPGTILTSTEIQDVRAAFCDQMKQNLDGLGLKVLAMGGRACADPGNQFRTFESLHRFSTKSGWENLIGYSSPLGWLRPERPFNDFHHGFTSQDAAFVVGGIQQFADMALGRTTQALAGETIGIT